MLSVLHCNNITCIIRLSSGLSWVGKERVALQLLFQDLNVAMGGVTLWTSPILCLFLRKRWNSWPPVKLTKCQARSHHQVQSCHFIKKRLSLTDTQTQQPSCHLSWPQSSLPSPILSDHSASGHKLASRITENQLALGRQSILPNKGTCD